MEASSSVIITQWLRRQQTDLTVELTWIYAADHSAAWWRVIVLDKGLQHRTNLDQVEERPDGERRKKKQACNMRDLQGRGAALLIRSELWPPWAQTLLIN